MSKDLSPIKQTATVVETVFEDFIGTLEADTAIDKTVIAGLRESLLRDKQYSADKLRNVLFSEETL